MSDSQTQQTVPFDERQGSAHIPDRGKNDGHIDAKWLQSDSGNAYAFPFVRGGRVANQNDIDRICRALLLVRSELEEHLACNDSWRALRTAELGTIVAQHLGSNADEDSKKLHRKLLRTSAAYRAYIRLVEVIRILSEASAEFFGPDAQSDVPASSAARPQPNGKPRVKIRAVSRPMLPPKARVA